MEINLIFARARNGVIGNQNTLPWHLPEDMAHFKRLTTGCPVIMGRKTWDSLPPRFRPLPNRTNIVLTRQENGESDSENNHQNSVKLLSSVQEALQFCEQISNAEAPQAIWVIGGAAIYEQFLPHACRVYVTEIHQNFEGDAFAPQLGIEWLETAREDHTSVNGMAFSFVTYQKKSEGM